MLSLSSKIAFKNSPDAKLRYCLSEHYPLFASKYYAIQYFYFVYIVKSYYTKSTDVRVYDKYKMPLLISVDSTVRVRMGLDIPFEAEYGDVTSTSYRALKQQIETALNNQICNQGPFQSKVLLTLLYNSIDYV